MWHPAFVTVRVLIFGFFILTMGCTPGFQASSAASEPTATPAPSVCSGAALTNSPYAGGTGDLLDPYLICTAAQMNAIGLTSGDWTKSFKLSTDIDLAAYTGTQYNIIGSQATPFTGVFDGGGYTISNFSLSNDVPDNVGLFGYVSGASAVVKNLSVSNAIIAINNDEVNMGVVIGRLNAGTISDCRVLSGTMTQTFGNSIQNVGGVVGRLTGGATATDLTSAINFLATNRCVNLGGVIGAAVASTIANSGYTGEMLVGADGLSTGGLVGNASNTAISNSYSTGKVRTSTGAAAVGGLVGAINGTSDVNRSYSTGAVESSGGYVGGFAGQLASLAGHGIYNSYSTSAVTATYASAIVGGFVGQIAGVSTPSITNSYSTGLITSNGTYVGGFVGEDFDAGSNRAIYTANFWNSQVNLLLIGIAHGTDAAGNTGGSTATMQTPATFTGAGWTSPTWNFATPAQYPRLGWQP